MVQAITLSGLVAAALLGSRLASGEEHEKEEKALLDALSKSKHTLADGIQQAAAKSPEAAISAKFELEDGKLSLSVYTVEKGLGVPAERNVLKELAGSPLEAKWSPNAEVFKDVPHVSRASEQLTLMALSHHSLLDVIKKAGKDQPGTLFSITPVVHNRKPIFVVLVAADGKVVHLSYDLMTGDRVKVEAPHGKIGDKGDKDDDDDDDDKK
jgi:hypothetical protein